MFAILGNHDDDHDMPAALAKQRRRRCCATRARALTIRGEAHRTRRHSLLDQAPGRHRRASCAAPPGPVILLAHDPGGSPKPRRLNMPLVLSGHTHGGQVVLPGLGAVAAQKFPVVAGIGRRERTTMFVSRGVGTVYVPVRINCPPEVGVLTLAGTALEPHVTVGRTQALFRKS